MARLGNTSISGLLRSASSAQQQKVAYDDALAKYNYEQSAKTAADFAEFSSYFNGRLEKTTDPAKQLALQKTLDSGRTTYQSAEITRLNTQINYGTASLTDKRNALVALRNQALAIGDLAQAQNLELQYTGVDKQIQQEAAAASKKKLNGYETELGSKYGTTLTKFDAAEKELQRRLATGEINATQFAAGMSQLNVNRQDTFSKLNNDQNGLTQADQEKLYNKFTSFVSGDGIKKYNAKTAALLAAGDIGFAEKKTDIGNGQVQTEAVPLKKVGAQLDSNGNIIPQYQTGRTGDNTFVRNIAGPNGAVGKRVEDLFNVPGEKGYGYIVDEQGKRFVGKTTQLPSGRMGEFTAKNLDTLKSLEAPIGSFDTGSGTGPLGAVADFVKTGVNGFLSGQTFKQIAGVLPKAATQTARVATNPVGALSQGISGLLGFNDMKAQQMQQKAAQAANAALVAQRAQQMQLLPAFRAPAYQPTPAPAKATTKLNFAPLANQPGYVNAIDKTKATIANPKSTARDALKALIGF